MRAATIGRYGPPEVVDITDVPMPSPARDEVLVRVRASTVSMADYRARTRDVPAGLKILASLALGFFRPRRAILGMDAAGVVESVGDDVTRFAPGDEVIAMLGSRFGGHAEYVCVGEDGAIAAKPSNLDFEQAAAIVFGGTTAHAFLSRVSIQPGDLVLVNGASGAVGSAAVQLAKHSGAIVTAVCRDANAALVRSLGADRVVDYPSHDFTADGIQYDVIVDCAGTAGFDRVERSLKPGGALVLVTTDLKGMALARLRSRKSGKQITASAAFTADSLAFVAQLAKTGHFRPVIDSTYDLTDVVEAHRYVATRRKSGNVVIRIDGSSSSTARPPLSAAQD